MKENLSQFVERIIRQKGLSFADVERSSNNEISASYIGRILKGTITNLTTEKMVALARGLEVDPYEIFAASYGESPATQGYSNLLVVLDTMQKLVMNPDVFEAMEQLLRLPPKERAVLLQPLKLVNKPKAKNKKKEC
jgi:transcriptional regulator with XRE-family HTH domain